MYDINFDVCYDIIKLRNIKWWFEYRLIFLAAANTLATFVLFFKDETAYPCHYTHEQNYLLHDKDENNDQYKIGDMITKENCNNLLGYF